MRILVTGGAGFIGSNFIRYWLNKHPNDEITNLDKLSYAGNLENLRTVENESRYSFFQGDVMDVNLVERLLKNAEGLIHFAAESHVTRSESNPDAFLKSNVEGTKNILQIAKDSAQLQRIIHISTDEVYGSIKSGYFKEEDKLPGDLQASSVYAKSKAQADDIAQSFFESLPLIIVRPTNNFGPYQYPEKALPRWITSALLDQEVEVWGEGKQVRDWLFVEDTAKALEVVWKNGKTGQIYNIGANHTKELTNITIAKKLLRHLGKSDSLIKHIADPRPDHDFRYGVNSSKIRTLGWEPGDFERQFEQTINWYRQNQSWWRPLKQEAERLYQR